MEIGRYLPVPGAIITSILLCFFLFWLTGQNSGKTMPQNLPVTGNNIKVTSSDINDKTPYSLILGLADLFLSSKHNGPNLSGSVGSRGNLTSSEGTNSNCEISRSFPDRIQKWCDLITKYATKNDLDPNLVAALIWQESGGNAQVYSQSGAVGLMQIMPKDGIAASFRCPNGPCFQNRPTVKQLKDPDFNLSFGTKMLAGLIKRKGNLREGLKAYGPADAGYSYADKVVSIYKQHQD